MFKVKFTLSLFHFYNFTSFTEIQKVVSFQALTVYCHSWAFFYLFFSGNIQNKLWRNFKTIKQNRKWKKKVKYWKIIQTRSIQIHFENPHTKIIFFIFCIVLLTDLLTLFFPVYSAHSHTRMYDRNEIEKTKWH